MLYYTKDKKFYTNRKEFRNAYGINLFKRECRLGNILYINPEGVFNSKTLEKL